MLRRIGLGVLFLLLQIGCVPPFPEDPPPATAPSPPIAVEAREPQPEDAAAPPAVPLLAQEPRGLAEYAATVRAPLELLQIPFAGRKTVEIEVTNNGSMLWDSDAEDPAFPVFVSFHLLGADGETLRFDNRRLALPRPVATGETVRLPLTIEAAELPGPGLYLLELDLVHEHVSWFAQQGSATTSLPVELLSLEVQPISSAQLARPSQSRLTASDPELAELWTLIGSTLQSSRTEFAAEGRAFAGFAAGSTYPQLWVRDNATTLPAARWLFDAPTLRGWLELHLEHQGQDGRIADWVDSAGLTDTNTTETDQETSLVLGACEYVRSVGDRDWLATTIGREPVAERLQRALLHAWSSRRDPASGLLRGAHTIDWGDVDIVDADQQAIYAGESTRWNVDIYDQSMFVLAARCWAEIAETHLADAVAATAWRARADRVTAITRRLLWQPERGYFRVHSHLDGLQHEFDEDAMLGTGGNAMAVLAGIASPEMALTTLDAIVDRHRRLGLPALGFTMLPPYPSGTFLHPSVDEEYEYQNGGHWDWFAGRLILAMFRSGRAEAASEALRTLARLSVSNGGIFEWSDRDLRPHGSARFSGAAGALGSALIEGYLGVELVAGSDGRLLRLSPRVGEGSVRVALVQPSDGARVAYDYRYDADARAIAMEIHTSAPTIELSVLLPRRLSGAVTLDGEPIEASVRELGADRYVDFTLVNPMSGFRLGVR